jgi:hypothetical protein
LTQQQQQRMKRRPRPLTTKASSWIQPKVCISPLLSSHCKQCSASLSPVRPFALLLVAPATMRSWAWLSWVWTQCASSHMCAHATRVAGWHGASSRLSPMRALLCSELVDISMMSFYVLWPFSL